jgi:hypothetical protein
MKLHVVVTPDHIQNGIADDPMACPVALAIESTEFTYYPNVGTHSVEIFIIGTHDPYDGHNTRAELPPEACAFIYAYDHHEHVEPIEFDLEFK